MIHRFIRHNHKDAMNMIWHHNRRVEPKARQVRGNALPALPHYVTTCVQLHFTSSDLAKEWFALVGTDSDEI